MEPRTLCLLGMFCYRWAMSSVLRFMKQSLTLHSRLAQLGMQVWQGMCHHARQTGYLIFFIVCMIWGTYVPLCSSGGRGGQRTTLWTWFSPFIFMWVLGLEVRWPGVCGKHFSPLSHLPRCPVTVCMSSFFLNVWPWVSWDLPSL